MKIRRPPFVRTLAVGSVLAFSGCVAWNPPPPENDAGMTQEITMPDDATDGSTTAADADVTQIPGDTVPDA
jgi:hypothetical protein